MKLGYRGVRGIAVVAALCAAAACDSPTSSLPGTGDRAEGLSLVSRSPQSTPSGVTVSRVTFRISDLAGQALAGASVRFVAGGGGVTSPASVVSDANGQVQTAWRLGVGTPQYLEARVPRPGRDTLVVRIDPSPQDDDGGTPATIALVSGGGQSGTAGHRLPDQVAFKVTDSNGHALPAVKLLFVTLAGGGGLEPDSVLTDFDGVAQAAWTIGFSGSQVMEARVPMDLDPPLTARATATIGTRAIAAHVVVVSGANQRGSAGQPLASPIVVAVTDADGVALPGQKVVFTVVSGSGDPSPDSAITGFDGRAATTWTMGTDGQQTLRATSGSVSADVQAILFAGIIVNNRPFGLAVSSAGVAYVTRLDAAAITVINPVSKSVTGTISVGYTPTGVAFNPAGTRAYVTNQYSGNVGVIDVASGTQAATVAVGGNPFYVAVSPNGARAYATTNSGMLYAINTATNALADSIALSGIGNGIAFSPDGSKLYVGIVTDSVVEEISLANDSVTRTFATARMPQGLVVSPNGAQLVVTTQSGTVEFWNLISGTRSASEAIPDGGFGVAQSPDGSRIAVSLLSQSVLVFDATSHTVVHTLATGGSPRRLAYTPDGTRLVVANQDGWVDVLRP